MGHPARKQLPVHSSAFELSYPRAANERDIERRDSKARSEPLSHCFVKQWRRPKSKRYSLHKPEAQYVFHMHFTQQREVRAERT
jgi:hypothetical protein